MNENKNFIKNRAKAKENYNRQLWSKRIAQSVQNNIRMDFITLLLDNQCASDVLDYGWQMFRFETHCMGTVEVVAKNINGRWIVRSSTIVS